MRLNVPPLYRWRVEIIEVVDHGNAPAAFREEPIHEMRADKTRPTGNEDVFH